MAVHLKKIHPSLVFVGTDEFKGPETLFGEEWELVRSCVHKRQIEFATGRWCMRMAMRSLGLSMGPILKGWGREPLLPDGIVGSISHTNGYCCALAARDCSALGLDVEYIDPSLDPEVWQLVCGDTERNQMSAIAGADLLKWNYLAFSSKESFFKCMFPIVGKYFGFNAVYAEVHPDKKTVLLRLEEDLDQQYTRGMIFEVKYVEMGEFVLTWICL